MDIKQMRYIVEIARTLNFTKAAETLYITQPALSQQVSVIEAELGFRVFERTTRSVRLTEDGEVFASRARRVLLEWDELEALASRLAERRRRELNIGMFMQSDYSRFPALLAEFAALHPDIYLNIAVYPEARLLSGVKDGSLDLIFLRCRPEELPPGLRAEKLFTDEIEIILNERDALAGRERLSKSELTDYKLICERDGFSNSYPSILGGFERERLSIGQPAIYISQASMLTHLLMRPGCFSFTTRESGRLLSECCGHIRSIPLEGALPVTVYVIRGGLSYNEDAETLCAFAQNWRWPQIEQTAD